MSTGYPADATRGVREIALLGWGNGLDGRAMLTAHITAAVAAGLARTMVDGYTATRHTWLTEAGRVVALRNGWVAVPLPE